MKLTNLFAILLLLLGAIILSYHGLTYTTHDKTLDIGPIQVTTEHSHAIPFAPATGVIFLFGGVMFMVMSLRKK